MKKFLCIILTALLCFAPSLTVLAAENEGNILTLGTKDSTHEVSELLYGVALEDVSFAGDGGLSANLINNGSFEDTEKPENGWVFDHTAAVLSKKDPLNKNNTNYELLAFDGRGTLENLGYTEIYDYKSFKYDDSSAQKGDMGFREDVKYDFSCFVKNVDFEGTISVYINTRANKGSAVQISTNGMGDTEWTQLTATLTSKETADGSLVIVFDGKGTLQFDFASLIPQDSYGYGKETWKNVNLRADMVEAIKNLNPSFIRFPGGALVDGSSTAQLYNWKNTIGKPSERKQTQNVWANASGGRYYVNSNSLGYHEYFQLCEDLNSTPVPVVNAGVARQTQSDYNDIMLAHRKLGMSDSEWKACLISEFGYSEKDEKGMAEFTKRIDSLNIKTEDDYKEALSSFILTPGTPAFDNYVHDVLDLVEYARGDANTSYWGALRAANGHDTPFDLRYLAIGNQNWGEYYFRNFAEIYKAVHKEYPDLTIIVSSGAEDDGDDFDASWAEINKNYTKCIADEQFSVTDSWLLSNNKRYDSYDRDGAGVMLGGLDVYSENSGKMITSVNMGTAVAVGSFMTSLERNSNIVKMACLAPAFAKVNANSADRGLVWFDSQELALSADYYTQLLFANNIGTKYVDSSFAGSGNISQSVTVDENKKTLYIKLVNSGTKERVTVSLGNYKASAASMQSMSHRFTSAPNEIGKQRVAPTEEEIEIENEGVVSVLLEGNSVNVLRIAYDGGSGDGFYSIPKTIDLETKSYVPAKSVITVIVLSVCLLGGMIAGYIIYAKVLSKRRKNPRDKE